MPECPWCERAFEPRKDEGKLQVYCSRLCRQSFRNAAASYVLAEVTAGRLDVDRVRKGRGGNVRVRNSGDSTLPGPEVAQAAPASPALSGGLPATSQTGDTSP
jgi:hypothetical protein